MLRGLTRGTQGSGRESGGRGQGPARLVYINKSNLPSVTRKCVVPLPEFGSSVLDNRFVDIQI